MAIAYVSTATAGVGTTVTGNVSFPANLNVGDLIVLVMTCKYPTIGTPSLSGWVLAGVSESTGNGTGVDAGDAAVAVFTRVCDGTEGATATFSNPGSGSSIYARMFRFTCSASKVFEIVAASGAVNTPTVAWVATMGSDPGLAAGDHVLIASGHTSDNAAASVHAIVATGCTFGTITERDDAGTSQGDDCRQVVYEAAVSTGPSSAAAVCSFTLSTAEAGGTVLVRLREVDPPLDDLEAAANITLGALTTTATAGVGLSAAANVTLGALTTTAAAGVGLSAAANLSLGALTAAAEANVGLSAEANVTLGDLTTTATATAALSAQADITLGALTTSSAAEVGVSGDASATLGALTVGATATVGLAAAADITLGALTTSSAAAAALAAAADVTLGALTTTAIASIGLAAAADITLGALTFDEDEVVEVESAPAFEDYSAELFLDDYLAEIELDDYTAELLLGEDGMGWTIKAGDLTPALSGRIRVPATIDLTGATLALVYRGRKGGRYARVATLVGRVPGSRTDWRWTYTLVAGDTDVADEYATTITATKGGLPATYPNVGTGHFEIEPQL